MFNVFVTALISRVEFVAYNCYVLQVGLRYNLYFSNSIRIVSVSSSFIHSLTAEVTLRHPILENRKFQLLKVKRVVLISLVTFGRLMSLITFRILYNLSLKCKKWHFSDSRFQNVWIFPSTFLMLPLPQKWAVLFFFVG